MSVGDVFLQITKRDVLWNYVGYTLRFFFGILIVPVLTYFLDSRELGVWYVFLSIGSLIQLLDLGFSPTISRNISYAYAGAKEIKADGVPAFYGVQANVILLAQIRRAAKRIYFYIACLAVVLLLSLGSLYIAFITKEFADNRYILLAWWLYSLGLFFNFYYSYWIAVLTGIGRIKEGQKATVLSSVVYIGILLVGIYFFNGLLVVAAAFLCSGIVRRWFCKWAFEQCIRLPQIQIERAELTKLCRLMWYNAKKSGMVAVGGFCINQMNTILASLYFDLTLVASYGLTLQAIGVLSVLAQVPVNSYIPLFSELQLKRERRNIIQLMGKTFIAFFLFFLLGAAALLFFGNDILELFHSKTYLLSTPMCILILLYTFLECNHGNFATVITAKNEVPFVRASLWSGGGMVIGSLFSLEILHMGLWGLLLARFLSQAVHQNWYWPYYVMRDLQVNFWQIFVSGVRGLFYGRRFWR